MVLGTALCGRFAHQGNARMLGHANLTQLLPATPQEALNGFGTFAGLLSAHGFAEQPLRVVARGQSLTGGLSST